LLVFHRQWQQLQRRLDFRWEGAAQDILSWLVTFSVMCLGWIFFRARDLREAFAMFESLLSPVSYGRPVLPLDLYLLTTVLVVGYFAAVTYLQSRRSESALPLPFPLELRYVIYSLALYLVVFRAAQPQSFIYTQF
jgi:hypothetical protein